MCLPKYRLLKSFIISLYDDTIKELMSTTDIDKIDHIYNYFDNTSNAYKGALDYAMRCTQRTELLDLIGENKIKIKNMIYGGGKDNGTD